MIDKMELSALALELRSQFGEDANSPIDIYALINQMPEYNKRRADLKREV